MFYSWLTGVGAELQKTHPDKILGTLAFTTYFAPPRNVKMSRRIMPYITFALADMYVPRCAKEARRLIADWGALVDRIGHYDYAYGSGYLVPRMYTPLVQQMLQFGLEHNLKGVYAEAYPNFGLDGPRLYLTARLWWNPHLDLDALFNEWNDRMFREAAEPMKKHFLRCRQAYVSFTGHDEWTTAFRSYVPRNPQYSFFLPADLDACTGYLAEAARLANSDIVKKRVDLYRKTWLQVSLFFANAYWSGEGARRLIEQDAPLQQIVAALKRMPESTKQEDFERALKKRIAEERLAIFSNALVSYRYCLKASTAPLPVPRPVEDRDRYLVPPRPAVEAQKAYKRLAARLLREATAQAAKTGSPTAARVRDAVDRRIGEVFGSDGSSAYRTAVAQIRRFMLEPDRPVQPASSIDTVPLAVDGWLFKPDPKNVGLREKWFLPSYEPTGWKKLRVDTSWEQQGFPDHDGFGWYRFTFTGANRPGKRTLLHFGAVDETAAVWIDGKLVGKHDEGLAGWDKPFDLDITPFLTNQKTEHLLAVQAHDDRAAGGIWRPVSLKYPPVKK